MSRKTCFNASEVNKLFEISEKFKNILECKKSDCISTKQKEDAWNKIAAEFNASSDIPRQTKDLKTKYKNVRYATKSKAAEVRKSIYGTGGGPPTECTLSAVEERMLGMITETEMEGVPNICDSDALHETDHNEVHAPVRSDDASEEILFNAPLPGPSTLRSRMSQPLWTGTRKPKESSWDKLAQTKSKWSEIKLNAEAELLKKVEKKVDLEKKLMQDKHNLEMKQMCERQDIEIQILAERLKKEKLEVNNLKKL